MPSQTVILITGVTKGIGKTLLSTYLLHPNYTVIGSVRDKASPAAQALTTLPTAPGSRLYIITIESSSFTDPGTAANEILEAGISHLDIVIANAGSSGPSGVVPLDAVTVEQLTYCFNVNTLGPLVLFQALKPLLQKSTNPRFVAVTSAVGSIGRVEVYGAHVAPAYGISKAGLNWVTVAVHSGNKWLTAFVIHPGLVQTDSGNAAARGMGLEKAPYTQEQCVGAIMSLVEQATREKSSGRFFDVISGTEIPW